MKTSEMRARFEAWWLNKHPGSQFNDLKRAGEGYEKGWLDDCWQAWQAALATPPGGSPQVAPGSEAQLASLAKGLNKMPAASGPERTPFNDWWAVEGYRHLPEHGEPPQHSYVAEKAWNAALAAQGAPGTREALETWSGLKETTSDCPYCDVPWEAHGTGGMDDCPYKQMDAQLAKGGLRLGSQPAGKTE